MRGALIGIGVLVVLIGGVLGGLVMLAEAGAPEPSEQRIEVTDALRSSL